MARPRDAAIAIDAPVLSAKTFVTGASRCGECHEKMFDEWEVSAHARATSSTLFKAAMADAKTADCNRCHAPLIARIGPDAPANEGITCDVCHTLRDPVPTAAGGSFRLAIDDMVKFGPRCNLKDHYFHRMGCSPEHDQAVICGACHWWEQKGVPIFTEFPDWQAGPAAQTSCQECHMPKDKAPIAVGSPARDGVPHHGLLGLATDLRKRAFGMSVFVTDDAGALVVSVDVKNVNGGHPIPSGLPERRIIVSAKVGDEVQRHALGRVLVDAAGAEVPFWRATRVGSDSRVPSGATRHEVFTFHTTGAGTADVTIAYRAMSEAVAAQLGQTITEEPLVHAAIAFDAKHAGAPVVVKPPAPGKRHAK